MNLIAKATICMLALAATGAYAHASAARQDPNAVRATVEQFLALQTTGLPGQVAVTVGRIDPRLNVAACAAPQAFLPGGSRAWGKTTVGVRCTEPTAWTLYVPATVQVTGEYWTTAAPLVQGQNIAAHDIIKQKGDLATLPAGIVTDPSQAIGRTLVTSLAAGMPLRQDALRGQQAVQQGQVVRLVTSGPGFRISSDARALNNAAEGQVAQARTSNGQVVSGVAKPGGILEIAY